MDETYDVVVIGGGAAGLSGALALARSRRSVLVIDGGEPRNAPAEHMHNYLGRDGTGPRDLIAAGRAEVEGYGGHLVTGAVETARATPDGGFLVALAGGAEVRARRLLVATGLVDDLPDVPGLAERFGRDVLHCPYCHGWEVRDQAIGVLNGGAGTHQALLFRQLSGDVTFLTHASAELADEDRETMHALGIRIVNGEVTGLETEGDRLTGVRLASGTTVPLDALVVAPRFTARASFLASLDLEITEFAVNGHVFGSHLVVDANGATGVPGVWAAGNVADLRAQVVTAAAQGLTAGAAINADLVAEDARHAVAALRGTVKKMFEEEFWQERYSAGDSVWSGEPNRHLVSDAGPLTPGTALDVGAGEGADAIWLAGRGWSVTAVDIAPAALARGAAHAEAAGVAGRIRWERADAVNWTPVEVYDLVSAQFMHLPREPREALYARLAAAVAPGGSLLIVGHHPKDLQGPVPRPQVPDLFFTAEELAAALDPGGWEIVAADTRSRAGKSHEGDGVTVYDTVLHARRLPEKK
ncbi:FAD-dependent oxidoreductase [Actinocorallia longicatena]|uniref:NAD(P)/FAD-dependent oxidoreductase n=1 Tax=Actinocorallia longicatena TaxID=111803 RepID=A0ABP6QB99_9ACTN